MWEGRICGMMTPVVLFFLTLPLFVGLSLVYGEETVIVTKAFNGREIKVRNGSMIQVELNQAGSAGYVWEIEDLDKEHFEVVSVQTPETSGEARFCWGACEEDVAHPRDSPGEISAKIHPRQALGGRREDNGHLCAEGPHPIERKGGSYDEEKKRNRCNVRYRGACCMYTVFHGRHGSICEPPGT